MKVSIVIPAYNEEKWIGKTLEAVSKQDYPDYEVIVVDNASADKTSEVVQGYMQKDSHIKLVKEPKKGILNAREAGRLAATGEIIVQLDADCLPKPNWITTAIPYFKSDKVVAVTGPYYFYDGPLWLRLIVGFGQNYIYRAGSIVFPWFGKGGVYVGGNFFIRASALKKIGGYDTSIDFYSEDADTGHRLSKIGRVLFQPQITVDSSARRFKAFGFNKVNNLYTRAYFTAFQGKKMKDNEETVHPR